MSKWVNRFSVVLLVALCGCKSHKAVTEIARIDTTKTVQDSVTVKIAAKDTTKTTAHSIVYEFVQFVDSGGTVLIDSSGGVSLQGVRLFEVAEAYEHQTSRGITLNADSVCESVRQSNGIEEQAKQEQPEAKTDKWYKSIVCRVITLCCIAALLYLLFLYIKKKT